MDIRLDVLALLAITGVAIYCMLREERRNESLFNDYISHNDFSQDITEEVEGE